MRVDVICIQYVDGNFSKNPILLQCNIRKDIFNAPLLLFHLYILYGIKLI